MNFKKDSRYRTQYKSYSDARVTLDKIQEEYGAWLVQLFIGGKLYDHMKCNSYQEATEYWKSFNNTAKLVK